MSSNLFLGPRGSLFTCRVELCMARWGGGAEPGMWHVFWGPGRARGVHNLSLQCVVDDFGNLIEVPA